ncbi:MAG: type I DNA topoisomerase [Lachnospirales bacterium]
MDKKPQKKTTNKKVKKNLVIVESPAKAKTLKKFLGNNFKIEASMGHVRDLPKSDLGINLEEDFEPRYITIRGKGDLLKLLRKEVKNAGKIYLATDPDREGEAISWHLHHALKLEDATDKEVYRITFNEITKKAVQNSIKEAREINLNLVDAQQARRALDRVVGYKISPILWAKVKKGLSAGRVQSVALKIICDREEEISNFVPEEYWTVDLNFAKNKKNFAARLNKKNGQNIEIKNSDEVEAIYKDIKNKEVFVSNIKEGKRNRKPQPPFKTSTLQQVANKHLGFLTNKTMQVAQQLYEGIDIKDHGTIGLVTYIRTDSLRISDDAYEESKIFITEKYGENYLPPVRNEYKTKANAQDAHEAIRPSYIDLTPEEVKDSLSNDQYKLYKLIWERFMGSQMNEAIFKTLTVDLDIKGKKDTYTFRLSGNIMEFDGFLKILKVQEDLEKDVELPEFTLNEVLNVLKIDKDQHFTKAPARYNDASLVNTLEERGIGRPSTYAPTISTIVKRGYVTREQRVIYPTELGEIINEIMEENFPDIIDDEFTANMESKLDQIEDGVIEWKDILRNFYPDFKIELEKAIDNIKDIDLKDEVTDVLCDKCGTNMVVKQSKYGKFLACPRFPECANTKPYLEYIEEKCPVCGGGVLAKTTKKGRKYFGCEFNGSEEKACEFISWYKPTGKLCPNCKEFLVIKGGKNPKIACSNTNCSYTEVLPELE